MAKETYYVTQEQLDLIEHFKNSDVPLFDLLHHDERYQKMGPLSDDIPDEFDKPLLRYLGGDTSIEFKVKEQLYRLWRIDYQGDKVFFFPLKGTEPNWSIDKRNAFTAPLEEIEKWKTPSWEIEEAD